MDRTLAPDEYEYEEFEGEDELGERGAPGGAGITLLFLMLLVVPFLAWVALPFLELDTHRYTAALVALSQYAVPTGVLIALFGLALRRWLSTLLVLLATAVMAVSVAPRVLPDAPAGASGEPLKVLSLNMFFGRADAEQVVRLVREENIDIVSLLELDAPAVAALDRAGLRAALPHRVFQPAEHGVGSGIASRHELEPLGLGAGSTLSQPSARVDLPGPRDVEFVAVHPVIPVGDTTNDVWRGEVLSLPKPAAEPSDTPRVLAGDFNATLDHTPLRRLLGRGYDDAAERTGSGLTPTWPGPGEYVPPPVTIDHVLVSGGIDVRDYRVAEVAGSDHRAVITQLVVPR